MKAPHYNDVNPRGCPGSYAKVPAGMTGKVTCPFCLGEWPINANGTVRAHKRKP